jgi:hypothetical protein
LHRPVVFQLNNFTIRTIEIWAEKTRDSSGLRDTTQLTENTLVFIAQSGDRWLLLPDHPGPGFVVAWGEKEINRFLHSGWYVLKHILDLLPLFHSAGSASSTFAPFRLWLCRCCMVTKALFCLRR